MSSLSRVLVAPASGNVGEAVVASLLEADIGVRAGLLDPTSVSETSRLDDGMELVRLDLTDPSTYAPALDGCDGLFLLRPPPISRVGPTLNALLGVAATSDVEHVVFSSVAGADSNRIVPHHRVEECLASGPLSWTILRPGFFAQNFGDAYRRDIVEQDRVYVPAGSGRVAFIDVRDLADVAAAVLSRPAQHAGWGYELTGPEAVTFGQAAQLLSGVVDRNISYEPATVLGYARHLRNQALPVPQIAVQTALHVGLRRGSAEAVFPTTTRLLGRAARPLKDYFEEHSRLWQRP